MRRIFAAVAVVFFITLFWVRHRGRLEMQREEARAEAERIRKEEVALLATKRDTGAYKAAAALDEAKLNRLRRDTRSAESEVRWLAVQALFLAKAPDGLKHLTHTLLSDDDTENRRKAAELISRAEDRRGLSALVRSLGDADAGVRVAALQSLARSGDPAVVRPVAGALQDFEAPVRLTAVRALDDLRKKIAEDRQKAADEERRRKAATADKLRGD